jgi:hypothetical protein
VVANNRWGVGMKLGEQRPVIAMRDRPLHHGNVLKSGGSRRWKIDLHSQRPDGRETFVPLPLAGFGATAEDRVIHGASLLTDANSTLVLF